MRQSPQVKRALRLGVGLASETKRHINSGLTHADRATRRARDAICAECEHYRTKSGKRCALCGCRVPWKIGWASSKCPDNPPRWEAVK